MTPAEEVASRKKPREPYGTRDVMLGRVWKCSLRPLRRELKLSMREVASQCKLSISAYYRIECGKDISLSTARRLAVFFGKSLEDIWPEPIDTVKEITNGTQ